MPLRLLLVLAMGVTLHAQTSMGIYDTNCATSGALTIAASVASGTHAVTPSSMTPASGQILATPQTLGIEIGTAQAEYVVITSTTGSTFTATFVNSHTGPFNINTYCWYAHFASINNLATDPIYVYAPGGGFTNWNTGCINTGPFRGVTNICAEIYAMTQRGYQVYIVTYSVNRDAPFPAGMQDFQAFLSYGVNIVLPGNWQNITTNCDSSGCLYVPMNAIRAKSAWNTISGTLPRTGTNNTNWNVVKAFANSWIVNFNDPINGWYVNCNNFVPNATNADNTCALQNLILTGNSGTTPSGAQLLTASPDNPAYLAEYLAKGCSPPIAAIYSSTDGTLYPPMQALLAPAASTAGCNTVTSTAIGQVGGAYTGHTLDEGTKGAFTWINVALSNTSFMSAAGSSGYCAYSFPTCSYIGLVFQSFWQFVEPKSGGFVP